MTVCFHNVCSNLPSFLPNPRSQSPRELAEDYARASRPMLLFQLILFPLGSLRSLSKCILTNRQGIENARHHHRPHPQNDPGRPALDQIAPGKLCNHSRVLESVHGQKLTSEGMSVVVYCVPQRHRHVNAVANVLAMIVRLLGPYVKTGSMI
jgi:hypothetical protein